MTGLEPTDTTDSEAQPLDSSPVKGSLPDADRVRSFPCMLVFARSFRSRALNALGTALTGRRGDGVFRLGDPIEVVVEEIRRWEGKVELSLAPRS